MDNQNIKIGISHGDINGISYEIIMKTLSDIRISEICTPIIYGSPKVVAYHKKALNQINFAFNNCRSAEEAQLKKVNLINCLDDNIKVELGLATPLAGESSLISLKKASDDLKGAKIHALVTAPLNKFTIQSKDFNFPGHTEFLTEKMGVKDHVMLLISDKIRVGVVAGHLPIAEVPSYITKERIISKLEIINQSMIRDFGIRKPKIAVLGLNPHCGEEGLLGNEEKDTIIPAIEKAKERKIEVFGPYSADGFFGTGQFSKFDVILAMYHDQGLAPFKAISFDYGVNYTAGLPVIRTSPAHGTGYDIAGKGIADENSFRQAMYMAIDIYKNRVEYDELSKNPLPVYSEKSKESAVS